MDLTGSDENLELLADELGIEVIPISGVTGAGLEHLTERIWTVLQEQKQAEEQESERA